MEQFTFFWKKDSIFSNWYPSKFKANGILFYNAEQYLMWKKAIIFGDEQMANVILAEQDPSKIKNMGRLIKNFDSHVWDKKKVSVMYDAVELKFRQNNALNTALLATKGTTLVEASPYDKIWGIGLSADDPRALDRSQWLGENLLGEVLTEYRDNRLYELKS
jgi:hypothetical protein